MEEKDKRPDLPGQEPSEISLMRQGKDTAKLTKKQISAIQLLKSGKYSAAEISVKLFCSSGRDVVRNLRDKGVEVKDEWREGEKCRYKVYFIEK